MNKICVTYVALLRGINVGGHRVRMERLRELLGELGFGNVRSFIQTGNIFFESDIEETLILQKQIEEHLERALGYAVPVCLRTMDELEDLMRLKPFKDRELTSDIRFSVTFLDREVESKLPVPSFTSDGGYELIGMRKKELFVIWHLKNGRPGNSYGFEKNIEAKATTRFWHTLEKMLVAVRK